MAVFEGLCGPTYTTWQVASIDRAINWVPIRREVPGPHPWNMVRTPGLRTFANSGTGKPVRGLYRFGDRVLSAIGTGIYDVYSSGALTQRGTIPDGYDAVTMADNGAGQICIAAEPYGFILEGNTFTQIRSEGLPAISQVQFLDGYFIGLEPNSRRIHISDLYDGMEWDPLDVKIKESAPDNVKSIRADHGELWILGDEISEVWYNSGNSDFPIERVPNGRLELGIAAANSAAKMDNSLYWLGHDERGNRVVWRARGYQAQRVSNDSVEIHLTAWGNVQSAVGWTYQERGHSFYCLRVALQPPYAEATWVFDQATGLWHERAFWDKTRGFWESHRARCHCFAWEKHLVGDRDNGRIYEQNMNFLDDDGEKIRRVRITPHLVNENVRMTLDEFQLHIQPGVGLGAVSTTEYGKGPLGEDYVQ